MARQWYSGIQSTLAGQTNNLPQGKNEKLLGELLKDSSFRSKVFICTKFGAYFSEGGLGCSGKPDYVRKCCEESLASLQVDSIDLYYQHRVRGFLPSLLPHCSRQRSSGWSDHSHRRYVERTQETQRRRKGQTPWYLGSYCRGNSQSPCCNAY